MTLQIEVSPFDTLNGRDVYELLALRSDVFVVEQACVYLDPDGLDLGARHVLARRGGALVGAARILATPWRIGRVVVARAARGDGLGRSLVAACLDEIGRTDPGATVTLSAQAHLRDFYAGFGFVVDGPVHDEDGIPHVAMRRP